MLPARRRIESEEDGESERVAELHHRGQSVPSMQLHGFSRNLKCTSTLSLWCVMETEIAVIKWGVLVLSESDTPEEGVFS